MPIIIYLSISFVVLVLYFVFADGRGVPWVPTSMNLVHTMLRMAEVGSGDLVYDLGCGDGRVLVAAARRYGARAVGYEINPLRYLWCQLLITVLGLRDRVRIVFGDFFDQDLGGAELSPVIFYRVRMNSSNSS
jgi:SAM-dependent methyltransferase